MATQLQSPPLWESESQPPAPVNDSISKIHLKQRSRPKAASPIKANEGGSGETERYPVLSTIGHETQTEEAQDHHSPG
jgi:hypothetical protein